MKDWKETRESKNEKGVTLLVAVIAVAVLLTIAIIVVLIVMSMGGQNRTETQAGSQDVAQTIPTVTNQAQETVQGTEGANGTKTLVQAFNNGEIQVGDYVNYVPDAHAPITVGTDKTGFTDSDGLLGTTDQTYTQDTTNTHWRVLGLTEDGSSVMLLGSQLKKDGNDPYLILQGARGYLSAESTLNEICSLYHSSALAQETRSIKIEDINRALGGITVTYPQAGERGTGAVTLNNTQIGETTYYQSYTYQSGDCSPESVTKIQYQLVGADQIGTSVIGASYEYQITGDRTLDYNFLQALATGDGVLDYSFLQSLGTSINERGYNMLFEGTTIDANYTKSYWLASSGADTRYANVYFGLGTVSHGTVGLAKRPLFISDGIWVSYGFAVRPIIVIKPEVTVDDVHKIADQTEQEWNTESENPYDSGYGG